jgi:hypothetical protein
MPHIARAVFLVVALVAVGLPAGAQTLGTIAGAVKDPSSAVLPGVTVEAASPALIERVRTASTDGTGLYRIVNLPPGIYTVTFTLPGFNQVRREGVQDAILVQNNTFGAAWQRPITIIQPRFVKLNARWDF